RRASGTDVASVASSTINYHGVSEIAMKRPLSFGAALIGALALTALSLSAQTAPQAMDLSQILASQSAGQPAVLQYNNRKITTLRASFGWRNPPAGGAAIVRSLDRVVGAGRRGRVRAREIRGVNVIVGGGRDAFGIVPQDVDTEGGKPAAAKTADTVRN